MGRMAEFHGRCIQEPQSDGGSTLAVGRPAQFAHPRWRIGAGGKLSVHWRGAGTRVRLAGLSVKNIAGPFADELLRPEKNGRSMV